MFPFEKSFGADRGVLTSRCSGLAEPSGREFIVEKAEIVPEGPSPGPECSGTSHPEHCLVQVMLNPGTGANGQKFVTGFDLHMKSARSNVIMYDLLLLPG